MLPKPNQDPQHHLGSLAPSSHYPNVVVAVVSGGGGCGCGWLSCFGTWPGPSDHGYLIAVRCGQMAEWLNMLVLIV